jgi:hypothetical protein
MRKTIVLLAVMAFVVGFATAGYAACKAGDKAQVLWKGTWYPATVKKAKGDQCFIHYTGYGNNWDEWVGPDRIKLRGETAQAAAPSKLDLSVGDPVDVNWKGSWYPAHVISTGKNRWKIHYDGYDNSWDEWVTASRIKSK